MLLSSPALDSVDPMLRRQDPNPRKLPRLAWPHNSCKRFVFPNVRWGVDCLGLVEISGKIYINCL